MTYAIQITHTNVTPPVSGWLLDNRRVAVYATPEDAEKALRRWRADRRYSWNNCRLEVAEYGRKP
jgi:hypothetical protein